MPYNIIHVVKRGSRLFTGSYCIHVCLESIFNRARTEHSSGTSSSHSLIVHSQSILVGLPHSLIVHAHSILVGLVVVTL